MATPGEVLRVAGENATEHERIEAYKIIRSVREAQGDILNYEEVLVQAEDIFQERIKSRGQKTLPLEPLDEPFDERWLNELRAQTGNLNQAR